MHPQVVWLFKKLKRMKDKKGKKGLTLEAVEMFCKGMNRRRYAAAMMGALFDISHGDTPLGIIVRDIDRKALLHQKNSNLKKYDQLLVEALDSGCESPLYEICKNYKNQFTGRLPDLDTTDFNLLAKESNNLKKAKLFDPANLF